MTGFQSAAVAVVAATFAVPAVPSARVITVDQRGTGDVTTVADAMQAASAGDTVAVRHGPHLVDSVELVSDVWLLGGWDDEFASRAPGTSHLQATGRQALTCTTGQGPGTIIDGFEISGATYSAILCSGASPIISNNDIHDNNSVDGGAVDCEYGASPIIEDNWLHDNRAIYGAAIRGHYGVDTSPTIRRNLIENNAATLSGGGISVNNGSPIIEDNVIRYNDAFSVGGGIHVWTAGGGVVVISQNIIVFNTATTGGGIGLSGGSAIIMNNTIWDNTASRAGGALSLNQGTASAAHNVLGGNVSGVVFDCQFSSVLTLDCNCVHDSGGGTYGTCPSGASDVLARPSFCDEAGGDYTLRADSPCASGVDGCGLIGARPVGCGAVSVESLSWGRIKAGFRAR